MRVNLPFSAVWKWLKSFAGVRLALWWRVNGVEIGVLDFGVLKFGDRGMAERLLLATMMRGALGPPADGPRRVSAEHERMTGGERT
jgi:hypothetical protein